MMYSCLSTPASEQLASELRVYGTYTVHTNKHNDIRPEKRALSEWGLPVEASHLRAFLALATPRRISVDSVGVRIRSKVVASAALNAGAIRENVPTKYYALKHCRARVICGHMWIVSESL